MSLRLSATSLHPPTVDRQIGCRTMLVAALLPLRMLTNNPSKTRNAISPSPGELEVGERVREAFRPRLVGVGTHFLATGLPQARA
jgi:hypothetical protein